MTTILQISSYSLSIAPQDSQIHFEAEHHPSGKIFTLIVDKDSVSQMTNNLFENTDNLIQGFKDAANKTHPGLSLDFDLEGNLTYNAVLSAGVIKKECNFTLELFEKFFTETEILERKVSALEQWKKKYEAKTLQSQKQNEKRFEKLENHIVEMNQKMTQILNQVEEFWKRFLLDSGPFFNKALTNTHYTLSDYRKTATLVVGSLLMRSAPYLEVLPKISLNKEYSYSFKMNTENKEFCLGITAEKAVDLFDGELSYWYAAGSGGIFGRVCKSPDVSGPFGGKDKILKMTVDMNQGTMTIFVDGRQVNSVSFVKSGKYFTWIRLKSVGDAVTLIYE